MIRHKFILLQRESEVGKMGQEVEAYFEELVEKFFPYIDLRAHTPTSVKSEGGKPKPKKIKRKSDEALLHVHWAIIFQFMNCWLCLSGRGGGRSICQEERRDHAMPRTCCCAISVGICVRSKEDKVEERFLTSTSVKDDINTANSEYWHITNCCAATSAWNMLLHH